MILIHFCPLIIIKCFQPVNIHFWPACSYFIWGPHLMAVVAMGFTGELCKVQIFVLWRETCHWYQFTGLFCVRNCSSEYLPVCKYCLYTHVHRVNVCILLWVYPDFLNIILFNSWNKSVKFTEIIYWKSIISAGLFEIYLCHLTSCLTLDKFLNLGALVSPRVKWR